MFKICFFVPVENCESVKDALFKAGAGRIGNYDCCSFETQGLGQFRALEGSNPHIGSQHKLEKVVEMKVEMVCDNRLLKNAIEALKSSHPYETPAYDVVKIEEF